MASWMLLGYIPFSSLSKIWDKDLIQSLGIWMRYLFEKLSTRDACCIVSCSINAKNKPCIFMFILASNMYAIPNFSLRYWLVPMNFSSPLISTPILSHRASASSIEFVVKTADNWRLDDKICFIVFQNCRFDLGSIPDVGSLFINKSKCKKINWDFSFRSFCIICFKYHLVRQVFGRQKLTEQKPIFVWCL